MPADDIVTQLKRTGDLLDRRAADEIERLRAVLEKIKAGRSKDPQWDAIQALKQPTK